MYSERCFSITLTPRCNLSVYGSLCSDRVSGSHSELVPLCLVVVCMVYI